MSPYIRRDRRTDVTPTFNRFKPENPGDLNFAITHIILQYLSNPENGKLNYEKYNSVMGVLTCIQHELYRREMAGYEDQKIIDNGDIY